MSLLNEKQWQAVAKFRLSMIQALNMTQALPVAAALYSITRAGVRLFGFALPGQCTNTMINLSFSTGVCAPIGSWLITRVSQNTSAHAWSWIMYGGFAVAVALWKRPPGSFNGWIAFMLVGFAVAVHELFWFFTYFVVHPYIPDVIINLEIYGSFIAMCGIGIVIFWLTRCFDLFDKKLLIAGLFVMGLFYAGWASIGYPLTLDLKTGMFTDLSFKTVSPLFNSGWVDFIEFGSWLLMFAVVGAAYYAKQTSDAGYNIGIQDGLSDAELV